MARFDVYRDRESSVYFLDCQADGLTGLTTRFVVPLVPLADAPKQASRLNPTFAIEGERVSMLTQFSASVFERDLGSVITSLAYEHDRIMSALDMLLTGY
jgi:toxin CcdB